MFNAFFSEYDNDQFREFFVDRLRNRDVDGPDVLRLFQRLSFLLTSRIVLDVAPSGSSTRPPSLPEQPRNLSVTMLFNSADARNGRELSFSQIPIKADRSQGVQRAKPTRVSRHIESKHFHVSKRPKKGCGFSESDAVNKCFRAPGRVRSF